MVDKDTLNELQARLCRNVVENIGFANLELVFAVLSATSGNAKLSTSELKTLMTKAIASPISKVCAHMYHILIQGYYADICEPYPICMSKLILLSVLDMSSILKYIGMMYFKGMDDIFWGFLIEESDEADLMKLQLLREMGEPTGWVLAYLYVYAKYNLQLSDAQIAQPDTWVPSLPPLSATNTEIYPIVCRRPISSGYFYIYNKSTSISSNVGLAAFNIKVENVNQLIKFDMQPGEHLRPCKFNSLQELLTASEKTVFHLQDFGTLQVCGEELYCWIGTRRYALVPHNTRAGAKNSADMDMLMYLLLSTLPHWGDCDIITHRSYVITIEEYLSTPTAMPKQCRTHYTIYEALPYAIPLDFPILTDAPPILSIMACMLLWFIFEIEGVIEIKHLRANHAYCKLQKSSNHKLSQNLIHAIKQLGSPVCLREYFASLALPATRQARLAIVQTLFI